jgi:2-keto-4-pentenoate hydratase
MSVDANVVNSVAARLRQAAESGVAIGPIRDELGDGGVTAAYAVQQANTDHYLKQGRRLVGRKIGLTSKSVQKQLGVDSPDFGMLFADMALYDGEEVQLGKVLQPRSKRSRVRAGTRSRAFRITLADGFRPWLRAGGRDRRQPHRELEHQAARHHCRQRVVRTLMLGTQLASSMRRPSHAGWRWSGAASRCPSARGPRNSAAQRGAVAGRTMVDAGSPLGAGAYHERRARPMVEVAPGDVLETRINGLGTVRAAFAA